MNDTVSLTLEQIDTINLSLEKALAVTRMVAECGGRRKPGEDEPAPASLFVVMSVVVEELEKTLETTSGLGSGTSGQSDDTEN